MASAVHHAGLEIIGEGLPDAAIDARLLHAPYALKAAQRFVIALSPAAPEDFHLKRIAAIKACLQVLGAVVGVAIEPHANVPALDQPDTVHSRDKPGRIDGEDGTGEILRVCLEGILAIEDVDGISVRLFGGEKDGR